MVIFEENSNWLESVKYLLDNLHKANFKNKDFIFKEEIIIYDPEIPEDPFETCCYFNKGTKLKQLEKHYYNPDNWKNLTYKNLDIVEIKTEKKQPCFYQIILDHDRKEVDVKFRKSDFLKKFRIDLYFIKEILSKYNMQDYKIRTCKLEETFLRMFYILILLKALPKEDLITYSQTNEFFKKALDMLEKEKIKNENGISKYKMLKRWVNYTVNSDYYKKLKEYVK